MPNMIYASTDEGLVKIMSIISECYTLPGADMDILDKLQDMITVHFQQKASAIGESAANMARADQQQSQQPPPSMNPGGMPMRIQPGGGAGMSGYGSPNPDELRRVLGGTGATV